MNRPGGLEGARAGSVALIGFPHDENSSYMSGAAEAPPLIRQALRSDSSNVWSESGVDLGAESLIFDAGDLDCRPPRDTAREIEESISLLLERGLRPLSLGGDHSITYPILKAFARHYPRLSVLHFDAHPDIYEDFLGNPHSHASPFARIMEQGLAERLVQVGIRTMNRHQREQTEKFGVEVFEMKDWRDDLSFDFTTPLYVTIDLDALDPAFAPGVSHHEPGGLSTRQLLNVIHSVKAQVVGADIVEYNPRRDIHGMTGMVCAKLIKEVASLMLST